MSRRCQPRDLVSLRRLLGRVSPLQQQGRVSRLRLLALDRPGRPRDTSEYAPECSRTARDDKQPDWYPGRPQRDLVNLRPRCIPGSELRQHNQLRVAGRRQICMKVTQRNPQPGNRHPRLVLVSELQRHSLPLDPLQRLLPSGSPVEPARPAARTTPESRTAPAPAARPAPESRSAPAARPSAPRTRDSNGSGGTARARPAPAARPETRPAPAARPEATRPAPQHGTPPPARSERSTKDTKEPR